MKNLIISLEASCDLSPELIKQNDLRVIDMNFMVDGQDYSTKTDTVESTGLYTSMRGGKKVSTSQINETQYTEFFENLLKEGKDVLHLAFSSGLSNTCNCAKAAAEEVNKSHKNKVYVIDSLCGCSGQGLLGILTSQYAKKAETVEQLITYVEKLKMRINHYFTVDTLKHLANGGRIKTSTMIIGNLLNIKPIIRLDENGKLTSSGKVMSRKKALLALFEKIKTTYDDEFETCIVSHSDSLKDAEFVADLIKNQTTLKPELLNIGPVLGAHCGPTVVVVFFVGKQGR